MNILLKIGTHPARSYYLCKQRTLPKINQWIDVKEENKDYIKPIRVYIDLIKDIDGVGLIFYGAL